MVLERIATDTYDFEIVRRMGYTYVDKTAILYPLVEGNIGRQFFLSRPRRLGKSLLISAVQKLFEGSRRDPFRAWPSMVRPGTGLIPTRAASGLLRVRPAHPVDQRQLRALGQRGPPDLRLRRL